MLGSQHAYFKLDWSKPDLSRFYRGSWNLQPSFPDKDYGMPKSADKFPFLIRLIKFFDLVGKDSSVSTFKP